MKVLYDSKIAAKRVTTEGWVSRQGHFYGDGYHAEHLARYDGCTHIVCTTRGCGNIITKDRIICKDCQARKELDRFNDMPRVLWDGKTPICIYNTDEYFFTIGQLLDYCEQHSVYPHNLHLVLCSPVYASEIPDDYYSHELPEESSLDDICPELDSLIQAVNDYIAENKPVLSWIPSSVAVDIDREYMQ